jgi:hypothetical protein
MKYLDASIRGVKLQKKQIPDSKKKSEWDIPIVIGTGN